MQTEFGAGCRAALARAALAMALFGGIVRAAAAQHAAAPAGYPPFSWDRVPIGADFGKAPDQFTNEEAKFIAKHFSLVSIEKGQAVPSVPYTEDGFTAAVPLIKHYNPNIKIIYYWNTRIGYFSGECSPLYNALNSFSSSWCDPGDTAWTWPCGSSPPQNCTMDPKLTYSPLYDLTTTSSTDFQNWWVSAAAGVVNGANADGVFADAAPASLNPTTPNANVIKMYSALDQALPTNPLLLYNGIQCDTTPPIKTSMPISLCPLLAGSLAYLQDNNLQFMSGAMVEHFGLIGNDIAPKNALAQKLILWALLNRIPNTSPPKIILFKGWPQTFSMWSTPHNQIMTYGQQVKSARRQITFPLACFLAVAQPYWYFDYSWGYAEPDAGVFTYYFDPKTGKNNYRLDPHWYREFDRPLGPPTGKAKVSRNGYVYTRSFLHAKVTCHVGEPKDSHITWH